MIPVKEHTVKFFNDRVPMLLVPVMLLYFAGSIVGVILTFAQVAWIIVSYVLVVRHDNSVEKLKNYNMVSQALNSVILVACAVNLIQVFD